MERIGQKLVSTFQYLRGYHASKIYSFDDFSVGLLPATEEAIKLRAKRLFVVHSDARAVQLERIVDNFEISNPGEIHYCLNRAGFRDAYQYHLFGSEDLMRIADAINEEIPTFGGRQHLVRTGTPVIVHVDVPTQQLSEQEVCEIAECIWECDSSTVDVDPDLPTFIHHKPIQRIVEIEEIESVQNRFGMPTW